MSAITITKARENLYNVVKEVHDNAEPILIVNSRGKNAVMMSEEEYESIQETLFFMENPVMMKKMVEAMNTPSNEYEEFDGWRK